MINKLIDFCLEKWPLITVAVILLAVFAWIVWRISKYYHSVEAMREKVNRLPCENYANRLNELKEQTRIVSSTHELVVEISRWIARKDKNMIDVLISKSSPYVITQIGFRILDESGGRKIIDDNLDFFIAELEKLNPDTPYDVEDRSVSILFKNVGSEMFKPLKNYIYYSPDKLEVPDPETNGNREVLLSLPGVLNVMGIYLRDKYMNKHPEIEQMTESV